MKIRDKLDIPVGTKAFVLAKLYYGVLSKSLESIDVERYYSILHFIYSNNGCTQQNICNNLAIDKTAMVKIMDYLIEAGFIERHKNPEDRREHFITLTEKGIKQTAEIIDVFDVLDSKIFSGTTEDEKDIFINVLQKAILNFKELPANSLIFNYTKTDKTPKAKKLTENKPNRNENT